MKINKIIDNYISDKKFSMTYRDKKLDVNNYSEILSFSDSLIKIRYGEEVYDIEGDNLVIARMVDNEVLISGVIKSVIKMQSK